MGNQHLGKYEIVDKIAAGGMGDVFKGYDPNIERYVAIKVLRLDTLSDPDIRQQFTERFLWEARIAGRMSHAHIVTIYESGTSGMAPYIVMEYIEHTLNDLLKKGRVFSENEIFLIMSQCCEALAYAHKKKVLHRDIKPSNILIKPESLLIKLTDFGIAKVPEMNGLTRVGEYLGTPGYMAPEQLQEGKVDGRADLFSLAVILYQMISGRKPFHGNVISTVIAKLLNDDPEFKLDAFMKPPFDAWLPLVQKALEKDPNKRFQTVKEFKTALDSVHQLHFSDRPARIPTCDFPTKVSASHIEIEDMAVKTSGWFPFWKFMKVICLLLLLGAAVFWGKGVLFPNVSKTQVNLFRVNYEGKVNLSGVTHPVFRFGDGINLSITPSATCYFYILYRDSERNITMLFPGDLCPGITNPLEKGKTYYFPTNETSFTVGGNPGREQIHVIGYARPHPMVKADSKSPTSAISWSLFQAILNQVENDQKQNTTFYIPINYELVR